MTDASRRTARELERLIHTGAQLSSSLNLDELLAVSASHAVEAGHTTFCYVSLLDEASGVLTIRAAQAVRTLSWELGLGERYRLSNLPQHWRAVEARAPVVVRRDIPSMDVQGEELRMLTGHIQSAALIPLSNGDGVLGVLTVGEMRRWQRSPFDRAKVKRLTSLADALGHSLMYVSLLRRITRAYEDFSSQYKQAVEAERQAAMADYALRLVDEFAQPLTAAWGFAQLLLKDADPADRERYAGLLRVVKSCERMASMLRDLQRLANQGPEPGRD